MSEDRNKRVEQEIAEILERSNFDQPASTPGRRYRPSRRKFRIRRESGIFTKVPPVILWLLGIFGTALLAIMIADWSRTLAIALAIASIVILFSPLVFWSRPSPIQQGPKEWRGRVIDLPPRQEGVIGKVRYKIWEIRNRYR
jgi:hypothetical protein